MTRFTRLTLCSGQTGTFMMIVEQLGLAIRPLCLWICSGFTSGTTSGTPSFIRNALVLSTTTAPAESAAGAGEKLDALDGEVALGEDRDELLPHGPGGPGDRDVHGHAHCSKGSKK